MAHQGDPSEITILKGKLKEYERKIKDLKKDERKLQKKVENHELKIKELEERLKTLKEEKEKLEQRIKALEQSEDELIIRQLCSKVQENILEIVLQGYFNKIQNKNIKDMENYIRTQIKDEDKQREELLRDEARKRWQELKNEIDWDDFLIRQFKGLKTGGNDAAHPPLTGRNIEKAKKNLERMKKLGEQQVKAVNVLKDMLKETNSKLARNRKRSAEREAPSRNMATKRQKNHVLPRRKAPKDNLNPRPPKIRQSKQSFAEVRDQSVTKTPPIYTSKVAGGYFNPCAQGYGSSFVPNGVV